MKRVHVIISGEVQGVFFRSNVQALAMKLGLTGWVRNTDGKVEAVFEGNDKEIGKMLNFCKKGPASARVSDVKVDETKADKRLIGFEIRY